MKKNLTQFVFSTVALSLSLSSLAQQPEHKQAEASSTSFTALTEKDYQGICTQLTDATEGPTASKQKALEVLSTEISKELLSALIFIDASSRALSGRNTLPLMTRGKIQAGLNTAQNRIDAGRIFVAAGAVTVVFPSAILTLFKKYFRKHTSLRSVVLTSGLNGVAGIGAGSHNMSAGLETKNRIETGLQTFVKDEVRVEEFVDVYAELLKLSNEDKSRLRFVLETAVNESIDKQAQIDLLDGDSPDYHSINVLQIMKAHKIGNPDMVDSLERLSEIFKSAPASKDQKISYALVQEQIQTLKKLIELIENKDLRKFLPKSTQVVHDSILSQAREKLASFEKVLEAIPEDCKK